MKDRRFSQFGLVAFFCTVLAVMLLSRGGVLASKARTNVADVVLNQILWRDDAVWRSSSRLALAASLYRGIRSNCVAPSSGPQTHKADVYLALATQSRRDKCAAQTADWLFLAATSRERREAPLRIPGYVDVDEAGDLVLSFGSSCWQFRADSDPATVEEVTPDHLVLNISNVAAHRETVVYMWRCPLDLDVWRVIHVRLKGSLGLLFTFEIHSQDGLHRYINYRRLSGDWENFAVTLVEPGANYVYFTFKEANLAVAEFGHTAELLTPTSGIH